MLTFTIIIMTSIFSINNGMLSNNYTFAVLSILHKVMT